MPTYLECQRCAACCRWPGEVRVGAAEIARLATHVGLDKHGFIQAFTRLRFDRRGLSLTEKPDGECTFLEGNECRVQAVKPQQCRDFPNRWNFPGSDQWCQAIPREVSESEYAELLARATGRPKSESPKSMPRKELPGDGNPGEYEDS